MEVLNIGYAQFINAGEIAAMLLPDSAPIRRTIKAARESGTLYDATQGKQTRCVIILTNGSVVLSAIQAETLVRRVSLPASIVYEA